GKSNLRVGASTSASFFFFQAEDGIRDFHVTGVQTCALPISSAPAPEWPAWTRTAVALPRQGHKYAFSIEPPIASGFSGRRCGPEDRKSTRLNSSHVKISYAVFCLKKKITSLSRLLIPV